MKTQPIETPYGRKTPELLVAAMDCYTKHQNNPIYDAAPDMFEALKNLLDWAESVADDRYDKPSCITEARTALQKAKGGK